MDSQFKICNQCGTRLATNAVTCPRCGTAAPEAFFVSQSTEPDAPARGARGRSFLAGSGGHRGRRVVRLPGPGGDGRLPDRRGKRLPG